MATPAYTQNFTFVIYDEGGDFGEALITCTKEQSKELKTAITDRLATLGYPTSDDTVEVIPEQDDADITLGVDETVTSDTAIKVLEYLGFDGPEGDTDDKADTPRNTRVAD